MNKIRYFLLLAVILGFSSCYKEEKLTLDTDDSKMALRYTFPQGNNSWDHDIVKMRDKFGFYVIYKELEEAHFNRTWLAGHGNTKYMGKSLNDEQAASNFKFFNDHVFSFFTPELLERVAPLYIYFGYDVVQYSYDAYLDTERWDPKAILIDGVDFWSFCLETDSSLEGGAQNLVPPSTPEDIFMTRGNFIYAIIKEIFKFEKIKTPVEFTTDFNYVTALNNKVIGGVEDVNHCNKRGFTGDFLSFKTSYATVANISGVDPDKNFQRYVLHVMRYSREQFLDKFPAAKFPKMIQYYDFTAQYLINNYQWNINMASVMPTIK